MGTSRLELIRAQQSQQLGKLRRSCLWPSPWDWGSLTSPTPSHLYSEEHALALCRHSGDTPKKPHLHRCVGSPSHPHHLPPLPRLWNVASPRGTPVDPDTPQLAQVSCGLASRRVLQPGLPTSQVGLCGEGGLGSSLGPENGTSPQFTGMGGRGLRQSDRHIWYSASSFSPRGSHP